MLFFFIVRWQKNPKGDEKVKEISGFIKEGANAVIKKEYTNYYRIRCSSFLCNWNLTIGDGQVH